MSPGTFAAMTPVTVVTDRDALPPAGTPIGALFIVSNPEPQLYCWTGAEWASVQNAPYAPPAYVTGIDRCGRGGDFESYEPRQRANYHDKQLEETIDESNGIRLVLADA